MDPANDNDPTASHFHETADAHQSRSEAVLIAGIIGSVAVAIATILRIHVRGFMVRRWGAEDTFLVFAAVSAYCPGTATSWLGRDHRHVDVLRS